MSPKSDEEDSYEDDCIDEQDEGPMTMTASNCNLLSHPTPIGGGRMKNEEEESCEYSSEESQQTEEDSESESKVIDNASSASELQQQLYKASRQLVKEGEKNVTMALELEKYKDELKQLKVEIESFRNILLRGINASEPKNYVNVSLDELLRLRIQESSSIATQESSSANDVDSILRQQSNESSVQVIQALEQKLGHEAQQYYSLQAKYNELKAELEASEKQTEDANNLRLKVSQMVQRLRKEREVKYKVQKDLSNEKSKVDLLSEHIEKLMVHLKHEAIAKARSMADQSRLQRELEMMKARNTVAAKKNDRKDQVISELRDGGKLLEDQLRLMDEKYMELRTKLDYCRSQTERVIKQKDEEVRELRMKFSEQMLLDNIRASNIQTHKPKARAATTGRGPVQREGRDSVIALHKKLASHFKDERER